MASAHAPRCNCSHTPPEYPSAATSTGLYSPPTPSHSFPTNQPSPQVVTTKHVQQFFDMLTSLGVKQGSSPPPTAAEIDSPEDAKPKKVMARASLLAFKEVNEVWVLNPCHVKHTH